MKPTYSDHKHPPIKSKRDLSRNPGTNLGKQVASIAAQPPEQVDINLPEDTKQQTQNTK
jgi:hypothetical protein